MTFEVGHVYVIHCSWIDPPHDKISLCISSEKNWFFWFNTEKKPHGVGQVVAPNGCHRAISKDCYLDISGVRTFGPNDLKTAQERGPLDDPLKAAVRGALEAGVKMLPASHRDLALAALK